MAEQAKAQDAPARDNKKIIIIAAAIVAVAILGAAAMFFLGGKGEKKAQAQETAKVEAKAETGGSHGGGEGHGGEGAAVGSYPLEPFIVNIYDGQEIRYLKVKVEFELATPQAKAE